MQVYADQVMRQIHDHMSLNLNFSAPEGSRELDAFARRCGCTSPTDQNSKILITSLPPVEFTDLHLYNLTLLIVYRQIYKS